MRRLTYSKKKPKKGFLFFAYFTHTIMKGMETLWIIFEGIGLLIVMLLF